MRPKAAFMESLEGSPAYTPEQKGSMRRSKTSAPRLRRINCSTLSSYAVGDTRQGRSGGGRAEHQKRDGRSEEGLGGQRRGGVLRRGGVGSQPRPALRPAGASADWQPKHKWYTITAGAPSHLSSTVALRPAHFGRLPGG
eukprot:366239-Chlamydomonas_euryale.AAC.14